MRRRLGPRIATVLLGYSPTTQTPFINLSFNPLWMPVIRKLIYRMVIPNTPKKTKGVILVGAPNIGKTSLVFNIEQKVLPMNDPFYIIGQRPNDFRKLLPGISKLIVFDDQNFRN